MKNKGNIQSYKLPDLVFPIEIMGRKFDLCTVMNTEIVLFMHNNMSSLEDFMNMHPKPGQKVSRPDLVNITQKYMDIFLSTNEIVNKSMRMMLTGDHTGIDWNKDVTFVTCVQISAAWFLAMKEQVESGIAFPELSQ